LFVVGKTVFSLAFPDIKQKYFNKKIVKNKSNYLISKNSKES